MTGLADQNPSKRPDDQEPKYCYPQCRDPWFNECADCWKSGGNPALYPRLADSNWCDRP